MDDRPFTCRYLPESSTLVVSGAIDYACTDELRTVVEKHTEKFTRDLTIDLADVTYLPSTGIGVLAVAMRRARDLGRDITLRAPTGTLAQRVLTLGGLPHTRE